MVQHRVQQRGAHVRAVRSETLRSGMRLGVLLLVASFGLGAAQARAQGLLNGQVTNTLTMSGVPGITVSIEPGGFEAVTSMSGNYSIVVGPGTYDVTVEDPRFGTFTQAGVMVPAMGTETLDIPLVPIAPVIVSGTVTGTAEPGATLDAEATWEILDGSSFVGVEWTAVENPDVVFSGANMANAMATLPDTETYKNALVTALAEPPIGEEDLPPNVELPPGEFPGGLQDRFQVVGINPFALEEAGLVTLRVTVTTTSGEHTDDVEVHTALPWKPAGAIRNVPIGIPVLLQGKAAEMPPHVYDWALATPPGSSASLTDSTSQNPWFVPDEDGKYTLTVTDPNTSDPVTLEVWAGTWHGVITGLGMDGLPLAEDCTFCHNDMVAPDQFTPWRETGHAEIFAQNLNTSPYYSESCFSCHGVGYDTEVSNGGFDDAVDFGSFLSAGLIGSPDPNNWNTVVSSYPATAKLANVQCENCHGPYVGGAHGRNDPSITLAADNCATCHGEPLRHARFQQWQLSGHANYELAIDESQNGECSRCHTANGFLAWLPVLLGEVPGDPLDPVTVTWGEDDSHPQTCVTCHDPHAPGTTSGSDPDVTVRIDGDTPPLAAGFTATNVGAGAICMTCHNTRRGLRNDDNFDEIAGTSDTTRSPHPGVQTDVVMGQNLYFVTTGTRGGHGFIEDTCVTCHMEATPPPDILSYNQGGTNHTFYASPDICAECHPGNADRTAEAVQMPVEAALATLLGDVEEAWLDLMAAQFALGRSVAFGSTTLTDVSQIAGVTFTESRGRQALEVELSGGGTAGPTAVNSINVANGGNPAGTLYQYADERLLKAGWNLNLLEGDASKGIHNPSFTNNAIAATTDAVAAIPEPGSAAALLAAGAALAALARRRAAR